MEKGALKDLKKKEEYREQKEQMENLYALGLDLEKRSIPIDSLVLMANFLEKKPRR